MPGLVTVAVLLLSVMNSHHIQVCSQIHCCVSELSFLLLFRETHFSISTDLPCFSKRDGLLAKLVESMFKSGQMKMQ